MVAFANVWAGADGAEVSVDLMRFGRDAPKGVMEALFVHLHEMGEGTGLSLVRRWAWRRCRASRSRRRRRSGTGWARFLYRHGESVYQLPGPAGVQGEVRPGLGAALSGVSRAA